jgi:hypothetical protein
MNSYLDKEQEKLTRELMEVEVKTNNGIQELLTTLQRKEEEIYQSQVNNVLTSCIMSSMISKSLHSLWCSMMHFRQHGESCDLQNI